MGCGREGSDLTGEVHGELAIAETAGGGAAGEVASVWREIGLYKREDVVVVPHVHRRVSEDDQCRHQSLPIHH